MKKKVAKFCLIYNIAIILSIVALVECPILFYSIMAIIEQSMEFPTAIMIIYSIFLLELISIVYLLFYAFQNLFTYILKVYKNRFKIIENT